ncbi:hypothetical protein MBLNU459_g3372t1 [Dothideomycetes sp. NU459]
MPSTTNPIVSGDLYDSSAARGQVNLEPDPAYFDRTLAMPDSEDDAAVRSRYRPFLLPPATAAADWVARLELSTALRIAEADLARTAGARVRVLVLYGSLRARSYSKLLALEAARVLWRLGCDVRVFDPAGLPVKGDERGDAHAAKVGELRGLSAWADGHVWVSPEQHGQVTGVFKNMIDWIPLAEGSVRPTQGRTLAVAQVSGGSQSFNSVNTLRVLGRWMRMFVIPNQSSVPMAYTQFSDADDLNERPGSEGGSRMLPSANRDRLVDCMEEFVKFTVVMRQGFDLFGDRFSEREERKRKKAKAMELEREKKLELVTNGSA